MTAAWKDIRGTVVDEEAVAVWNAANKRSRDAYRASQKDVWRTLVCEACGVATVSPKGLAIHRAQWCKGAA